MREILLAAVLIMFLLTFIVFTAYSFWNMGYKAGMQEIIEKDTNPGAGWGSSIDKE